MKQLFCTFFHFTLYSVFRPEAFIKKKKTKKHMYFEVNFIFTVLPYWTCIQQRYDVVIDVTVLCLFWGFSPKSTHLGMSSTVSLPNHTFSWAGLVLQAIYQYLCTFFLQKLICPSLINSREKITVENISKSISAKECYRTQRESNPRSPYHQSDAHPISHNIHP